jgi:16S rRNA (cytosine1402-N4)-methyltransferase
MHGHEKDETAIHRPVLSREVIHWLRPERGGLFIDCTLGPGGHSQALLEASPAVEVIGIDRDSEAIELARRRLAGFGQRFRVAHASFADLDSIAGGLEAGHADGILADLGVSSLQFDRTERGFSFDREAPLDMRMDQSQGATAATLVNRLSEGELADLIFEYGEERGSRRIARLIVREREREPIRTTQQLAAVVVRALNVKGRWRIHPATRTFQALRIAVNGELDALTSLIPAAVSRLTRGGRLAIISFHSLEDRIVKQGFRRESGHCICENPVSRRRPRVGDRPDGICCLQCGARKRIEILTRKPIRPSEEEVAANPRSRSALLRVCERL